uniref:RING-type domain-containing protein n=1 Tax=Oryza punctata TaxID=4537 RepID=A0A0E0L1B8_ORYPU
MDGDGGGSPDHYGGGGGGGIHLVCEYCGHGSEYAEDDAEDGFFTCRQCSAIHTSTQNTATNPFDFPMTPSHLSVRRHPTQPTPTPKPFPAPRGGGAPAFDDLGEPSEPRDFAPGANGWGNPEDLAARVRWRYVRGLQVILQRQLEALVERHRVGSLVAGLAGTIWLRWVAASKVFDEMWVQKMLAIAESVEGHSASNDKQSELEGDGQKSQSSYEFLFLRSLRTILPVYSTLAVCFLACHVARETILPTDICRWAMEGKLPYVAAFTQVDKLLGSSLNDCPLSSRQLFRPTRVIGAWQLEAAAGSIAQKIGLLLPSVNFYSIAQRFLKELSLPIEKILPHACRIYEWAMPAELWLSSNPGRVPSRVCVMAILIVALRVLYGINGQGIWESIAQTESTVGSDPEASVPHSIEPDSNNNEEFDARELLYTLAASFDKIDVGHDYSKEVHSYLKYCKDVVFTGMTFSLEEEHLIEIFWDMYKGKEDENAKLCQEKLRTTNGVNKRFRDGRFEDIGINKEHNSILIQVRGGKRVQRASVYPRPRPTSCAAPGPRPLPAADASGMLPGPLLPPPPPPPPELVVYPSVLSLPPSATPPSSSSSSIGSSIAIVVLVVITTAIVTVAIVVIRRSYRRGRRLSCSSFSPRRSLSPRALSSSSSAMSQMWRAAVAAVGSSPRASAASIRSWPEIAAPSSAPGDPGRAPPVALANSAQGAMQGTAGLMASSATSAAATAPPSAPSLPEVERVILELLSLPPSPLQPAMSSTATCFICNKLLLPTDLLLVLPVCSHMFHQRCLVAWLRSRVTPLLCCPECHAPITTRCCADKKSLVPTFCSGEYDIESQILAVPAPPGEEVAEAVGDSRGWLRSSLDRLSGSWRACSGSRAVAAVAAPGCSSSRRTTGSWSPGSTSGRHLHLGADSHGIQTQTQVQLQLPVLPLADEEVAAADDAGGGGSRGWLRSSLATLSGSWAVFPTTSRSTAMELPVSSSRRTTAGSIDSWSGSWDPEALGVSEPQPRERPSVLDYARWLFRNSGK